MRAPVDCCRFRRTAAGLAMAAGLAAAIAGAQPGPAGPPAGRTGHATIYSTDRRFMVSGMTSAENMVLARKLAELAAAVEKKTGLPLPMRRDQVLGVMVQSSTSPDAQILKMQGWDGGRFYQRLVVPGRYRLDGEDLLEGACWLLLNRYAAEYTASGRRMGLGATMPEWISTGLAQNTQPALKSRNRDWVARELAEGRRMPLARVIRQERLPPGRWREKAYAAAAVEFLFPDGDPAAWGTLFRAVGSRQDIDAAWLREHCPALGNLHPEAAWSRHLTARARTRTMAAWSDRGLQLEQQLLEILNFRPHEMAGGVPDEVPPDLFARDLIEYRGQDWTIPAAASLSLQVQSLKLGAPPVLQEVLASYAAYFDQLATPPAPKSGWWPFRRKKTDRIRPPDDATWLVALNQLWLRAERVHQGFLIRNQSRKRYVDGFDRAEPGSFDLPGPAADLPRTRWQRYVDEVEERLSRDPF